MKQSLIRGIATIAIVVGLNQQAGSGVLLVTTTADAGAGSLRWAIAQAQVSGPDSIRFGIPLNDPGYDALHGVWRIRPKTGYGVITDGRLVIDGASQAAFAGWDANFEGPEIEIDGEDLADGVSVFAIMAPEVSVEALTINRCKSSAILFHGVNGGKVVRCYLGTTPDGMAGAGNLQGIWIRAKSRNVSVGRAGNPLEGNILSGNQTGVLVDDSCRSIAVDANVVGVNRSGSDTISNGLCGITLQGGCDSVYISDNLVGGRKTGILISGSTHAAIVSNSIGTDSVWSHNLGILGDGIVFDFYARDNFAARNIIGNCDRAGIRVFGSGSVRDRLTMNRISRIIGKAIETSFGANAGLPPPAIVSVTAGAVSGTAGPGDYVEVFADDSLQARYVCGSTQANLSGTFVLPLGNPIGRRYVTATATDSAGNTSELSAVFVVPTVDVRTQAGTPSEFALSQNYPNPFNASTVVRYQVPGGTSHGSGPGGQGLGASGQSPELSNLPSGGSSVRLVVYDQLGREVVVLANERRQPGIYEVRFDGSRLASGMYLCRLTAGEYIESRTMLLMK